MKKLRSEILILLLLPLVLAGCGTGAGGVASDVGLAGAGGVLGYKLSDGNAGVAAAGAAAGYVASKVAQSEYKSAAQKAEKVRGDIAIASREIADVSARVKDMDRLGVDVQVIYPTLFLVYITDDPELDTALSKAYNSWLGDGCAKSKVHPGRMRNRCLARKRHLDDVHARMNGTEAGDTTRNSWRNALTRESL